MRGLPAVAVVLFLLLWSLLLTGRVRGKNIIIIIISEREERGSDDGTVCNRKMHEDGLKWVRKDMNADPIRPKIWTDGQISTRWRMRASWTCLPLKREALLNRLTGRERSYLELVPVLLLRWTDSVLVLGS
ncbi:hypothetical protein ASPWEDRAFT_38428 [Aspergillus wentii DTO 134E9]|uniref:Uncharacterized protein n=1 Tax=Aspergillus wentii DTO 134E9 TaxID=1073089 RepID=A0A1L9RPC1_ASPWE|nr:uncharacterized protein ASPWEDRAFT_38428 [Aspergillus wentii DTO 134E9]OJJ36790.1 hypothetical protein ASPWEDRAFT_38428 [Aspergillus wentii DTO 134E9]